MECFYTFRYLISKQKKKPTYGLSISRVLQPAETIFHEIPYYVMEIN